MMLRSIIHDDTSTSINSSKKRLADPSFPSKNEVIESPYQRQRTDRYDEVATCATSTNELPDAAAPTQEPITLVAPAPSPSPTPSDEMVAHRSWSSCSSYSSSVSSSPTPSTSSNHDSYYSDDSSDETEGKHHRSSKKLSPSPGSRKHRQKLKGRANGGQGKRKSKKKSSSSSSSPKITTTASPSSQPSTSICDIEGVLEMIVNTCYDNTGNFSTQQPCDQKLKITFVRSRTNGFRYVHAGLYAKVIGSNAANAKSRVVKHVLTDFGSDESFAAALQMKMDKDTSKLTGHYICQGTSWYIRWHYEVISCILSPKRNTGAGRDDALTQARLMLSTLLDVSGDLRGDLPLPSGTRTVKELISSPKVSPRSYQRRTPVSSPQKARSVTTLPSSPSLSPTPCHSLTPLPPSPLPFSPSLSSTTSNDYSDDELSLSPSTALSELPWMLPNYGVPLPDNFVEEWLTIDVDQGSISQPLPPLY
jgi:hypothetical protein